MSPPLEATAGAFLPAAHATNTSNPERTRSYGCENNRMSELSPAPCRHPLKCRWARANASANRTAIPRMRRRFHTSGHVPNAGVVSGPYDWPITLSSSDGRVELTKRKFRRVRGLYPRTMIGSVSHDTESDESISTLHSGQRERSPAGRPISVCGRCGAMLGVGPNGAPHCDCEDIDPDS